MTATDVISPFSYTQHDWDIEWKRIPSNVKYDRPYEPESKKDQEILEAIACVGVIGGLQLKNLFNVDRQHIKKMMQRHLLVEHQIWKNNDKAIPIYTIGKAGANKIMPEYKQNYWMEMNVEDVLKCLSFFQFCYLFQDKEVSILPAPEPFSGSVQMDGKLFLIYVTRGKVEDLLMFLKWRKNFSDRIFIITESISYLKGLDVFIETLSLKVRVVLDKDLKDRTSMFYYYQQGKGWMT